MPDVGGAKMLHRLAMKISDEQQPDDRWHKAVMDAAMSRFDQSVLPEKSDMAHSNALQEVRALVGDSRAQLTSSAAERAGALLDAIPDALPEKHFLKCILTAREMESHTPDASFVQPLSSALTADPWNAIYLAFAQEADELCGTELERLHEESAQELREIRRIQQKI